MKTKLTLSIALAVLVKFTGTAQCTFTTAISSAVSVTTCGSNTLSVPTHTNWVQKADVGGTARHSAVGFSIGNKGYIGTGQQSTLKNDFWEYDPATDVWTQKANFMGSARYMSVGFSIGTKGYVGLGWDGSGYRNNFYEYDLSSNSWSAKANYPGGAREGAFAFSLGNLGYVGGGFNGSHTNTFYEYNPVNNVWTAKANFGGGNRSSAIAFALNGIGYVGMGNNGSNQSDLWAYNATSDTWTQKSSAGLSARSLSSAFALSTKAYLVAGHDGTVALNEVYEYDDVLDTWTQKANFPSAPRFKASGFAVGNRGYLGVGTETAAVATFWEYSPDNQVLWSTTETTDSIVVTTSGTYTVNVTNADGCVATSTIALTVHPNPTVTVANGTICAGNSFTLVPSGATTYSYSSGEVVSPVNTTTYEVIGISQQSCTSKVPVTVTVSVSNFTLPTIAINHGDTAVCAGNSLVLTANGANTYTWSNGSVGSAITVTPSGLSSYSLTGTDLNNCYNFATITVSLNSLPAVQASASSASVCNGSSVSLSASGATSYTWTGGATSQSITENPTLTTTYSVTGEDANKCRNAATVSVSVNPLPNVQITGAASVLCNGESLELTASGATTFDWGSQVTTATLVITPTVTTTYSVVGTDSEGCSKMASVSVGVDACTGLKENASYKEQLFSVFPNPSNGEINIIAKQKGIIQLQNMLGQTTLQVEIKEGENLLDLTNLPNGVYFASYQQSSRSQVIRIVKH